MTIRAMISRLTLTAILLAFATMASAQRLAPRALNTFKSKPLTAQERGLDTRDALAAYNEFIKHLPEKKTQYAKSSSSFTARLDSAVNLQNVRLTFAYDGNGNSTLELFSFWESPGYWLPASQTQTAYNGDNLPIEIILSAYDDGAMDLVPFDRETFTYLDGGLVDELVTYGWDGSEWIAWTKGVRSYNDDGDLSEIHFYIWDYLNGTFELSAKEVYTYNASGGLTELLSLNWTGSDWLNSSRLSFTLNVSNDVVLEEFSFWQSGQASWLLLTSNAYTYNAAGLETEAIYYQWNEAQQVLVPQARDLRTYDDMGLRISEEYLFWNGIDSLWMNQLLHTFEYDDADNVLLVLYHDWNSIAGEYVADQWESMTYNNDYPSEGIMAPKWFREFTAHMLLNSTYSYNDMGVPTEEQSIDFYYTLLDALASEQAGKASFAVYPNPFRESIILSGADEIQRFTLYDLQGRVILQKQMSGAREVHPGKLPAGVYVYQIEGINALQTGKLVKE